MATAVDQQLETPLNSDAERETGLVCSLDSPIYDALTDVTIDVEDEVAYQLIKWGEQTRTPGLWSLILTEEMGEAAKEALENNPQALRAELLQVAAVAVNWVMQLDREATT